MENSENFSLSILVCTECARVWQLKTGGDGILFKPIPRIFVDNKNKLCEDCNLIGIETKALYFILIY